MVYSGEDIVTRLRENEEYKINDVLTEGEYEGIRKSLIDEIVAHIRVPTIARVTFAVLSIGCIVLIGWGIQFEVTELATAGLIALVPACLMWINTERAYAAKQALPRERRLLIVEELHREQLITEDEAMECRKRIEVL